MVTKTNFADSSKSAMSVLLIIRCGVAPEEERLRAWFGKWFKEHSTLPRGPVLGDQRHLLRRAERLVGREKELGQVREWLTAAARFRRPAAKVVVIGGMAGVGKTALAQAVGRDPMVERYFRDGVLWAQLGPKPLPCGTGIPDHRQ